VKKFSFVLVLTILALIPTLTHAGWWKTYGGESHDYGNCVRQLEDGGYIVTGATYSFSKGEYDLWLLRMDENGDTIWTRTYGGTKRDWGNSVQPTPDGGYIITGTTASFGAGNYDLWLIKTDSDGDTVWTRTYGGKNIDRGNSIQSTLDGAYIITGSTEEILPYSYPKYLWVLKIDSLGDTLWTKMYYGYNEGFYVQQTSDNGYIIAGERQTVMGERDLWLLKTDELGDSLWTLIYNWGWNEEGRPSEERAYSVKETIDGCYITCGHSSIQVEESGWWIVKTLVLKVDSVGNELWANRYCSGVCKSIEQLNDDGYVIGGEIGTDILLLRISEQGEELWTKNYGGDLYDWANDMQLTDDGGYILTGVVDRDFYGVGTGNLFLLKTDSLGLVAVSEPVTPVTHQSDWQVQVSIGSQITLRAPEGGEPLNLAVFDASGRMVDEIHLAGQTLTWGEGYGPGVYFIRIEGDASATTHKVILIH